MWWVWVGFQRIHTKKRIGKLTGVLKVFLSDVGGKRLKQEEFKKVIDVPEAEGRKQN